MKNLKLLVIFLFLPLLAVPAVFGAEIDIKACLPTAGELGGWKPVGQPERMKGEDLFLLINGGAEVYHEYGFKEVLAQGFKNGNKKSFNLEIFRMASADAAYGIYTFKTGDEGQPLDTGDEGLLEEYYLNFRKGSYLVTITGFDSEKETLDGLVRAAKVIAAKIKETAPPPELLKRLPGRYKKELKPHGIIYLKGPLALYNQYAFDSKDIFGLKEGLAVQYNTFRLFLFKYKNNKEAGAMFTRASKFLEINGRFSDFAGSPSSLSMKDKKNRILYAEYYGRYIVILMTGGQPLSRLTAVAGQIKSQL